ncbi:MAG: hypothetical protein KatS3mg077_2850 [Candidatus Binatia bacterium]|nr:MAG: hypothetical protein KatS3mg077_2850 [Candidatus Binatia bacterium]
MTPTAGLTVCPGDCDGDGQVAVFEIVRMVNVLLGALPVDACTAGDLCGDGRITIDEVILAVRALLQGCPFPVNPDRCGP